MYIHPFPCSDQLSPDVIATRVNNLFVAMDTDNYTLSRRRKDQVTYSLCVSMLLLLHHI